jgi:murein DD-endopeptidase MepM/ murein hydrolase activator NlpD
LRKKKYYYDTTTHRFEKLIVPLRVRLLRFLGFISASMVTALIMLAIAYRYLPSPREKQSSAALREMEEKYEALSTNFEQLNQSVKELEEKDNEVYRAIFESEPLPDSVRRGKNYSKVIKQYAYQPAEKILAQLQEDVKTLNNRLAIQKNSYDTLLRMANAKEKMLACIPAIQPVSNKGLTHLASGFGYRIDPVYKTPKLHAGLDFATAMGSPIYATADATVASTSYDDGGYGNYVVLTHGYGYQTLYGHMIKIKVKAGERVARGQIIGWVGSTGKSTGPHCHYEVIYKGNKIDPIHYFFHDLSAADYDRMVRIAAASNQSFD